MNRHRGFLNDIDDTFDDDYYDEEEYDEEYYEDEEEIEGTYDDIPATENIQPPAKPSCPYISIHPDKDADYAVLDANLTALHDKWKADAPTMRPLTEAEAVSALREANYSLDAAVPILIARREAAKAAKAGGDAGSLRIATAVRGQPENASAAAATAAGDDKNGAEAAGEQKPEANRVPAELTENMKEMLANDKRQDCTFVVAGHVDAGKSTTLGHLLLQLGRVSAKEVAQNERHGKDMHKESFKYAWLLDQSEEERRRGVTIDSGSFSFETEHRRVQILDAPGHKDFVLNMISSATQADAAMLVVSAARSEFETGLKHGTKDHLLVLKTLGVSSLVVAVNKMDAVDYSEERFNYVVQELQDLMTQMHTPHSAVVGFCPMSGMSGTNITAKDPVALPWYTGPCLLDLIDGCPLQNRLLLGPLRLSLQDVQGDTLYGKVEQGTLTRGSSLVFAPGGAQISVKSISKPASSDGPVTTAFAGDTVEITTTSSLAAVFPGCVGFQAEFPLKASREFTAHIQTFPTLQKAILPGSVFTMVVHAITAHVKVVALVSKRDDQTGDWSKGRVKCIPASAQGKVTFRCDTKLALEAATECRALGRFVLQQDGELVAGGLVTDVMDV